MIEKVVSTIKKYDLIQKGESVLVGLSGGPDSVCLLHVLSLISEELGINTYGVHINHLLRGEEAYRDQQYVLELCAKLGIPVFIRPVNVREVAAQRGLSLEEAGREVRYEQFNVISEEIGASKIAVAHNRNDQAETILMRLIRGTGLFGLRGMEYKRDRIIRPLLDVERKDIEAYCRDNLLNPIIDSSNTDKAFTRNKIRLELIPYINNSFDTDITKTLCRMSELLKDDIDYIEAEAADLYDRCVEFCVNNEAGLRIEQLHNQPEALVKRVIRNAIKDIKGDIKGIESNHVEKIVELAFWGKTGSLIHLPHGIRAAKSYGLLKIYLYQEGNTLSCVEKPLNIPGITIAEEFKLKIEAEILNTGKARKEEVHNGTRLFSQLFDYDALGTGINIRNRKKGDIFKPLKSKGTKKLKEYLIDNKVPREARDSIPLIASGREIVWIIGDKISDKFAVTDNTKSVLKLTCIKYCEE